jgi:hypothetical protein
MEAVQLPRHVIDRLENRWAADCSRTQEPGAATRPDPLSPAMCNSTARGLFPLSSSALDLPRTPLSRIELFEATKCHSDKTRRQ